MIYVSRAHRQNKPVNTALAYVAAAEHAKQKCLSSLLMIGRGYQFCVGIMTASLFTEQIQPDQSCPLRYDSTAIRM